MCNGVNGSRKETTEFWAWKQIYNSDKLQQQTYMGGHLPLLHGTTHISPHAKLTPRTMRADMCPTSISAHCAVDEVCCTVKIRLLSM